MNSELFNQIWQVCLLPLLGVLTTFAVKFLNAKSKEINGKVESDTAKKYIEMVNSTIINCVIATNQTYVDSLKQQGKFDGEAQKVAFEKTLDAVMNILTDDAKTYIAHTTGDLTIYLTQLIEAEVNKNKA